MQFLWLSVDETCSDNQEISITAWDATCHSFKIVSNYKILQSSMYLVDSISRVPVPISLSMPTNSWYSSYPKTYQSYLVLGWMKKHSYNWQHGGSNVKCTSGSQITISNTSHYTHFLKNIACFIFYCIQSKYFFRAVFTPTMRYIYAVSLAVRHTSCPMLSTRRLNCANSVL